MCSKQFEDVKEVTPSPTILDLPSEILLAIFQQFQHETIAKCAQVCTRFNELSKDPSLFRGISVDTNTRDSYAEWLLNRSTNPRKMWVRKGHGFDLVAIKLSTWNILEELHLCFLDLREIGQGSLEKLKKISVQQCSINCKTFRELLRHSTAICKVCFVLNDCSQCGEICNAGVMSLIDFEACANNIDEITICSRSDVTQDLNRLSACTRLKNLVLYESALKPERHTSISEGALAIKMISRKCTALEFVLFCNLAFITDDILAVLFANCTRLQEFNLIGLSNVTEKSCIEAINVLPQLQKIAIFDCVLFSQSSETNLLDAVDRMRRRSSTYAPPTIYFRLSDMTPLPFV